MMLMNMCKPQSLDRINGTVMFPNTFAAFGNLGAVRTDGHWFFPPVNSFVTLNSSLFLLRTDGTVGSHTTGSLAGRGIRARRRNGSIISSRNILEFIYSSTLACFARVQRYGFFIYSFTKRD